MQPGTATDQIQISLSPQSPSSQPTSTQHGILHSVGGSSGASLRWPGSDGIGLDGVKQGSAVSANSLKANRIAQYEAMTTHASSHGGGPGAGFIVTKTNWAGRDPGDSPIARFPNEVLIHTLSFLEPQALLGASLVSKRFHALVNSSQLWRAAFVQFFPPPHVQLDGHGSPLSPQDRRYFTRLCPWDATENAWMKEHMQRTRLLRRLGRGTHRGLQVTYPARTGRLSVSHMAARFTPTGIRAVHASLEAEVVTASDPTTGKIERRREGESPHWLFDRVHDYRRVRLHHPDEPVAVDMGVDWVMDISEELGWIMGENVPNGRCYVHLSPYPHFYAAALDYIPSGNAPGLANSTKYGSKPLVTCVWIAKKRSVCDSTGAAVVVGNSRGFIRVFSIKFEKCRYTLAHVTSYCISPGIPIVQVKVDQDFLPRRLRQKRPWLVAINALGEVYYLRDLPNSGATDGWAMIPQTARIPTDVHKDVFPVLAGLSPDEEKEMHDRRIGLLMNMDYSKVKEIWEECRMDWFIEVDWAGQNIVAGSRSTGSGTARDMPRLKRYHLWKAKNDGAPCRIAHGQDGRGASWSKSVFNAATDSSSSSSSPSQSGITTPLGELSEDGKEGQRDEWMVTALSLPNTFTQITAHSMDNSRLARLTAAEDPAFRDGVPGANGRLFAVGTNTGSVFVYNIRPAGGGLLDDSEHRPTAPPLRTIHTDSPRITTLGVSSLVVVHGGNDGLVQAWDPLASTNLAVRTLHSRHSRRRPGQHHGAEAAAEDDQFAARCLILDPDPTTLRGIVALGTFVRYWNLSATDTKKARKTWAGARSRGGGTPGRNRGALQEVIHNDERAMRLEREGQQREAARLEERYGVASGRAPLNEEEMLAYAQMVSLEAFEAESSSRKSEVASRLGSGGIGTDSPDGFEGSTGMVGGAAAKAKDPEDADLELALRLSRHEALVNEMQPEDRGGSGSVCQGGGQSAFTSSNLGHGPASARPLSGKASSDSHRSPPNRKATKKKGWEKVSLDGDEGYGAYSAWRGEDKREHELEDDLELAIRLSLQEQVSQGKGKGPAQ